MKKTIITVLMMVAVLMTVMAQDYSKMSNRQFKAAVQEFYNTYVGMQQNRDYWAAEYYTTYSEDAGKRLEYCWNRLSELDKKGDAIVAEIERRNIKKDKAAQTIANAFRQASNTAYGMVRRCAHGEVLGTHCNIPRNR